MSGVSLTASVRTTLNALKNTSTSLETTTNRLSTGKKVSSAIDNPTNYFAAENYTDRADSLSNRLDGMSEATEMINAADNGITNIKSYLSQMKGVVNNALSNTDSDQRASYGKQFNELIVQVRDMAKDSSYGGINLINGNASSTVEFGENIGDSSLTLQGFNITAASGAVNASGELGSSSVTGGDGSNYALTLDVSGKGVVGIKSYAASANSGAATTDALSSYSVDWSSSNYQDLLNTVVKEIEGVEGSLQTQSSQLANNLAIITTREDYTNASIDILNNGADDLTLADMNEEGANLLSLQTSQSLAVQSLSLASSSAANVLSIIR